MGARFLLLGLGCVGVALADLLGVFPLALPPWTHAVWGVGALVGFLQFHAVGRTLRSWRRLSRDHGLQLRAPGFVAGLFGAATMRLEGRYRDAALIVETTKDEANVLETRISVPNARFDPTTDEVPRKQALADQLEALYGRRVGLEWGTRLGVVVRHHLPSAADIEATIACVDSALTSPPGGAPGALGG